MMNYNGVNQMLKENAQVAIRRYTGRGVTISEVNKFWSK